MLFNSLYFIFVFFPVVTFGYFVLPWRWRWLWLLLASCFFYMCFIPKYIVILALAIIIDYFVGRILETCRPDRKKLYLILSICSNLGLLFFFKYFDFFAGNVNAISSLLGWNYSISSLKIILPIGLSFHTFQSLSYIIEVYRGRQPAERHFGIFALYVMFYPQLVAGPIERPQNLLPQLHRPMDFDYRKFVSGLQLALWGLFKKVVIADRVSFFVNQIFNHSSAYQGPHFILATFLFAIQIYCDFSGYSDIARGVARVMGYELMRNFRAPYFSASISEFWQRWHISLSSWFRDYVFYPISLSAERLSRFRMFFAIAITFALSGLWHGANWTYVIWGGLNGLYLIIERLFPIRARSFLAHVCAIVWNFSLVCLAWVFFRAPSFNEAMSIWARIISNGYDLPLMKNYLVSNGASLAIVAALVIFLFFSDWLAFEGGAEKLKLHREFWRPAFFVFILSAVLVLGRFINSQFIYFQF